MFNKKLNFINIIDDKTNYREEQKELIVKAIEITDNNLDALNYIATGILHETGESPEFTLIVKIPSNTGIVITLPIIEKHSDLGYYVEWGDGISYNIKSHKYKSLEYTKEYTIRFFGLDIIGFGNSDYCNYNKYLIKVISFGKLGSNFTSLANSFNRCYDLISIPDYLPSNIINTSGMFCRCYKFNSPIKWDTSNLVNINHMFCGCEQFNQILDWDTSNLLTMNWAFSFCTNFNKQLNWNVSKVISMEGAFSNSVNFNQYLEWDVSNVINMSYMFGYCIKFNQSLKWNVKNVKDMSYMFVNCINFNKYLKWDINKNVNMLNMFKGVNIITNI